jgi:hypothetical protein
VWKVLRVLPLLPVLANSRPSGKKRLFLLVVLMSASLSIPSFAQPRTSTVTIKTNWAESFQYRAANGNVELGLFVRKIEFRTNGWTAWVGLTNRSRVTVKITAAVQRPNPRTPFGYWAGPGIWWTTFVPSDKSRPGSSTTFTHSARAFIVRPAFPKVLLPHKSWYGTFTGSLTKVPKDRLLRIGFGTIELPSNTAVIHQGRLVMVPRMIAISTSHQFKVPRKR